PSVGTIVSSTGGDMRIARWSSSRRVVFDRPRSTRFVLPFSIAILIFVGISLPGCRSKKANEEGTPSAQAPADSIELLFTYGSEKEKWIAEVTNQFNREDHRAQGGKRIFVRAVPMGSGELIDEVLNGTRQPH